MAYQPAESLTLVFDGHLHVYRGHDLGELADACLTSLTALSGKTGAVQAAALLTESAGCDFFRKARRGLPRMAADGGCAIEPGPDADTLWLKHPRHERALLVFAGRQIATADNLEVLALTRDLELPDGLSLRDTLQRIRDGGAWPSLAWAPGKWWGTRGRLVSEILSGKEFATAVSDSAWRPLGWREPAPMRAAALRGYPVLAGSDPLPIRGAEGLAGRYACRVTMHAWDARRPADALRAALARGGDGFRRVGRRCSPTAWLRGQIAYRIARRAGKLLK